MTASNSDRWNADPGPSAQDLARIARGDVAAFGRLVERYQNMAYSVAYNVLGDHMDAEDAAQEAFLRCYRKIDQYRHESLFSTWLFRIVLSCSLDMRRRRQGRPQPVMTTDLEALEGIDLDSGLHASTLLAALAALPQEYRVPTVLRDVYGLPYQDIADVLDCSTGAARVMVHRGRQALRRNLMDQGLGPNGQKDGG